MKRIIISICLYSFVPLVSNGQNCKEPFLGSKTLYQSQQQKYSAPPKGYAPVFINHVGRHGARHLTKDVNSSFIYQLLFQADSANGLSAAGKLLKEKIVRLEKAEKKNFKSISFRGKTEQQGLADRMYANYSNVFNNTKPVLHISYTKEIRTLQTSDAFVTALKTRINEPEIAKQLNDTTLRFYDMSPAYDAYKENGNWLQYLQQLKAAEKYNQLATKITAQFFTPSYFKNIAAKDQDKFTADLYGFITIFYSVQKEIEDAGYTIADVDMQSFLTCTQLFTLGKIDNAEDFFVKGPGADVNGIQVKIALPLLADFIITTDEYVKTKTVNAQLRFSHAETISPYATLLGLTTAATATRSVSSINRIWNADKVIPLSSNIQWILYKKQGSENYLVKFLLNEKEVAVKGLLTKTFPYYNWNDVRSFYIKKMENFNAGINTEFVKYLNEIK
ncbi:histidine-type phosphatase [Ferruginibacter sp. SUN106]|uniref:histidine-type phosphatase n=1 Tax=Ferruginibacter sp. SUN106 TaxID=2978348 RepID=UPI003D35DC1E